MLPGGSLAAQLGLEHKQPPYTNTRLVLASEVTDDDYFFGGTVVRCFLAPNSHPSVRQTLQGLEFRCGAGLLGEMRGCRAPGRSWQLPDSRLTRSCVPRRPAGL